MKKTLLITLLFSTQVSAVTSEEIEESYTVLGVSSHCLELTKDIYEAPNSEYYIYNSVKVNATILKGIAKGRLEATNSYKVAQHNSYKNEFKTFNIQACDNILNKLDGYI